MLSFWSRIGQTVPMTAERPRETRAESRERITAELMAAARRQLAEVGAAGLSLREVAREIGMVSSAVYRYVDSRDDLLTRLIVEAYDALGEAAESAGAAAVAAAPGDDLARWCAIAGAVRAWALEHTHQYLLLYGTPVPGYAAPELTVGSGVRVTLALVEVIGDAHDAGRLAPPSEPPLIAPDPLPSELAQLAGRAATAIDPTTILAFLAAWTQMFGLISFEITNQTRGMVESHALLYDATVHRLGYQIGLRGPGDHRTAS